MAIGNVVGSNTFNALMIISLHGGGTTHQSWWGNHEQKKYRWWFFLRWYFLLCQWCDARSRQWKYNRADWRTYSAHFLSFFLAIYILPLRNGGEEVGEEQKIKEMPVWKSVLFIVGGLAGLIFGGNSLLKEQAVLPVAGCQRICYRIDFGGRRCFVAQSWPLLLHALKKNPVLPSEMW